MLRQTHENGHPSKAPRSMYLAFLDARILEMTSRINLSQLLKFQA